MFNRFDKLEIQQALQRRRIKIKYAKCNQNVRYSELKKH